MRKIISFICVFIVGLFVGVDKANAEALNDTCIDKEECVAICNYELTYESNRHFDRYNEKYEFDEETRNITVYYLYNTDNIRIKWQRSDTDVLYATGNLANMKGLSMGDGTSTGTTAFVSVSWESNKPTITADNFSCPENAYVDIDTNKNICFDDDGTTCLSNTNHTYQKDSKKLSSVVKDYDIVEDTRQAISKETLDKYASGDLKLNITLNFDVGSGCSSYLGSPEYNSEADVQSPAYYLQFVFNLMKYLAIILLFVLTVVEYAKAIPSGKDDAIKVATMNTFKRIILAVIIFFLPILIEFILKLVGIYSADGCGIS